MTDAIDAPYDFSPFEPDRFSPGRAFPARAGRSASPGRSASRVAPVFVIIALGAFFGVWTLYLRPIDSPDRLATPLPATAPAPLATAPQNPSPNVYGALFDPGFASGEAPAPLSKSFPLAANFASAPGAPSAAMAEPDAAAPEFAPEALQFAEGAPLPPPRPREFAALRAPPGALDRRPPQQAAVAPAPVDNRGFFEKIFGGFASQQPTQAQQPKSVLAYAAPDDGGVKASLGGGFGGGLSNILGGAGAPNAPASAPRAAVSPPARLERGTAVYDVSARTVYMPNGTRLEAHSGLGPLKDDPRYVHERMRGATPPNVYELSLREALFHGVRALRLTPTAGHVYGRTGLLAHRYMLGPNGDSNGCVSFKDYEAFLRAYDNGEIKRLAVVARLN